MQIRSKTLKGLMSTRATSFIKDPTIR